MWGGIVARHLSRDFADGQTEDLLSAYATADSGRHLRKPTVEFVPTVPTETFAMPRLEDPNADQVARAHVEEIFRELSASISSTKSDGTKKDPADSTSFKSSVLSDSVPNVGPLHSQLPNFVPDVDSFSIYESEPSVDDFFTSDDFFETSETTMIDPSSTVVLDQQKLHGLLRRHETMNYRQVEIVAPPTFMDTVLGYFKPKNLSQAENNGSFSLSDQRKSVITTIAEFFARLFGKDERQSQQSDWAR